MLTLHETNPSDLGFTVQLSDPAYNRTFLTYWSNKDERFFGFGEQYSYFDMKGKRLPIFCTEQGVGRGEQPVTFGVSLTAGSGGSWYTTYAGVPHYITSQLAVTIFRRTMSTLIFDLRQDNRVQLQVWSPNVTGHILSGDSPSALIKTYTDFTGPCARCPIGSSPGAVVGMQGGTEKVSNVYRQLQNMGTPIAAFWLQDWVGQRITSFGKQLWWNWEVDTGRYPGWEGLVSSFGNKGVRVMTYVNPFLVDVSEKPYSRRNLYKEAEGHGYLVKNKAGGTYVIKTAAFNSGLLDLSNPDAYDWMKSVIKDQVIGREPKAGWPISERNCPMTQCCIPV